jgi:hypothetical protein
MSKGALIFAAVLSKTYALQKTVKLLAHHCLTRAIVMEAT